MLPDAGHADPLAIGAKKSAFSIVSFDKTSARPSHPVQVLVLPPDDILRRLKKPEFYLWTLITIQVEMAPPITESRSDYQHTSILTHSNSTTTTIRQETPDFVLQRPRKKLWLLISQDVYVDRHCHACENFFRIRKCLHHRQRSRQSIKKKPASWTGRIESGKPWAREKLERERHRLELFGYCSWYKIVDSTLLCCKQNHVANRIFFKS